MNRNKKMFGQGIIEVVFAVGVIGLVLTGVITLVIKSVNSNSKAMTRDKAVELANVVMEDLVAQQKSDPVVFWTLTEVALGEPKSGFDGYTYGVVFTEDSTNGSCVSPGRVDCAQVDVTVSWQAESVKEVTFSRFFRR